MTRVLVLSNMYPPHHYGGYELSCRDVVDRHRARGHEVTVLTTTMRVPGVEDVPDERDLGVLRDLDFYFRDADLWAPPRRHRPGIERRNQDVLRTTLDALQPDVVSIWHMGAMSLGLLTTLAGTGIPLVYAVCDDWLIYGPDLDCWMRLFLARPRLGGLASRLFRVPTTLPDVGTTGSFCFVSELTRSRAESLSRWRYPDATVVYSGIDRDDFPPLGRVEPRPWRWRLLFVGRLDERKGIETALRALALLPAEATLDILGRGNEDYRQFLLSMVDELGLGGRVRFDVISRGELAARYAAADAFLFPSEWDEPFGLVPVEAMACGTPVVATANGGSAEFLADGSNCLVFPSGDPAGLAAAVERLAASPELRQRLVAGGLRTADDLTVDRLADVFEAWHVAAATGFPDGRPPPRRLALSGALEA